MLRFVEGLRVQGGHAPAAFEPEGQVDGAGCVAAGLVALQGAQAHAQVAAMALRDSVWSQRQAL